MRYEDFVFKIPQESLTYREDSAFVIQQITAILDARKAANDNKIIINTNLHTGLPLENGPVDKGGKYVRSMVE